MWRWFHFNFKLKAVDDAAKAKANEANEAKANEASFADEAFDAKADEVDEPTSGQNKAEANEADVVIMPAKADEADAVDATEADKAKATEAKEADEAKADEANEAEAN